MRLQLLLQQQQQQHFPQRSRHVHCPQKGVKRLRNHSLHASTDVYTALDHATAARVLQPPTLDISAIIGGAQPTRNLIQQVQRECIDTGFLALTGHGVEGDQLQRLFTAGARFFDLPQDVKEKYIVEQMQCGRGYEISPEHKEYMCSFQKQQQHQAAGNAAAAAPWERIALAEPSAAVGILSERFCCGPCLQGVDLHDPYYSSELGRVFFTTDAWPDAEVPQLRAAMRGSFASMLRVAEAALRLLAGALGAEAEFFVERLRRHHSNLQVANYPSQLLPPGGATLRKKAHVDSGTLTLLASDHWLSGSSWKPGDGGLQLLCSEGGWLEVAVPPGALLLNLGSLMTRWTNGRWKSTLHRVTNPAPQQLGTSTRRLSVALFHKVDYNAVIDVLPSCLAPGEVAPLPVQASQLTRQGILHALRHLPPAEGSARYHQVMAAVRRM